MRGTDWAVTLASFNAADTEDAMAVMLSCCASRRFAAGVVAGRPYPSFAAVQEAIAAAFESLDWADILEALAGHPRIGDPSPPGPAGGTSAAAGRPGHEPEASTGWSRQEQAGVQAADQAIVRALAEGNEAYERRFGHIYLVCATGRSGAELLALLRERLGNDPAAEWDVVRGELAKINRIRLRKLLEATG